MDDWSLLPSWDAVSEPAPKPQSTMNNSATIPARLTRPRQARPARADHSRPQYTALDSAGLAWQHHNESGAEPQNPSKYTRFSVHRDHPALSTQKILALALDNTRPFMDDIEASFRLDAVVCGDAWRRARRIARTTAGSFARPARCSPPPPARALDRFGYWRNPADSWAELQTAEGDHG